MVCRECCIAWLTSRVGEEGRSALEPCQLRLRRLRGLGLGGGRGGMLCDDATVAKFERFTKLRGDEGHFLCTATAPSARP